MGLGRYLGAQIEAAEEVTDLRQRYDALGFCKLNSEDDFYAI